MNQSIFRPVFSPDSGLEFWSMCSAEFGELLLMLLLCFYKSKNTKRQYLDHISFEKIEVKKQDVSEESEQARKLDGLKRL